MCSSDPVQINSEELASECARAVQNCILNVCQPGSSLLAAGYCLYSSSTVLVITVGDGVFGFTYDSIVGEFIMSHPNMKVHKPSIASSLR